MLFSPNLVPKTVEDLILGTDEEAALMALENSLKEQFKSIREHMKDVNPMGVSRSNIVDESEPEGEAEDEDEEEMMEDDGSEGQGPP